MTLKKMLFIVGAAMALVAFAAPAMAQAQSDEWYTDTVGGVEHTLGTTTATGDTVVFKGSLTTTKFPLKQTCNEVTVHTTLWNPEHTVEVEEELVWEHTATGEVHSLTFDQLPCTVAVFNLEAGGYVDVPGCEITEFETGGFPWHVDVATGANGIAIIGANFTNTYNGCGALGIPNGAKLGFNGTLTGTWNSATHCIESSNSGDLKNAVEEFVLLDAVLCS